MQDDIKKAIETLRKGGIILYPTDTVWGIGCDATNEQAVAKIYALKHRSDNKAMLVLLDSATKLQYYVEEVPSVAYQLIETAENPITIIYPTAKNLASNLIASDKSIGIRITNEPFSNQLCKLFDKPIVSTSANISGETAPEIFAEIKPEILCKIDFAPLYGRENTIRKKPSSIIKFFADGTFKIIRP